MASKLPAWAFEKIKYFSKFPQTSVSLRQMVEFGQKPSQGTILKATQFLKEELPIRLAHRVVELENLPHDLSAMPSVVRVRDWYAESFKELIEFPKLDLPRTFKVKERISPTPNTAPAGHRYFHPVEDVEVPPEIVEYNKDFVKVIENIKRRHDPVVTTIAQGIKEMKESKHFQEIDTEVQGFLDRFYMSRIGIRMLIGQHIALTKAPPQEDYVGIIGTRTNIAQVATEAIDNARFICEDHYALFKAPAVQLHCPRDLNFMYVPSHLHHMIFELLKNSLRAVVETTGVDADEYPAIKVIVAEGKEDITIKISDEGGGIPRSGIPLIWTYLYTTAKPPELDPNFAKSDFKAPMAGFGYGLPISRLYARYFGGDLRLISMEGYGTDAYLHLSRLSDSEEPLP